MPRQRHQYQACLCTAPFDATLYESLSKKIAIHTTNLIDDRQQTTLPLAGHQVVQLLVAALEAAGVERAQAVLVAKQDAQVLRADDAEAVELVQERKARLFRNLSAASRDGR